VRPRSPQPLRDWVAEDFTRAAEHRGPPVLHIWGLDVPPLSGYTRPAWWTPAEHAARLLLAGVPLPLLATGPAGSLTYRPRCWAGRCGPDR
jgi:hypothetical protein